MGRVGEVHEALIERPAKRGDLMLARTRQNFLVLVDVPQSSIGEYRTHDGGDGQGAAAGGGVWYEWDDKVFVFFQNSPFLPPRIESAAVALSARAGTLDNHGQGLLGKHVSFDQQSGCV